jgi:hypothetical protein
MTWPLCRAEYEHRALCASGSASKDSLSLGHGAWCYAGRVERLLSVSRAIEDQPIRVACCGP